MSLYFEKKLDFFKDRSDLFDSGFTQLQNYFFTRSFHRQQRPKI